MGLAIEQVHGSKKGFRRSDALTAVIIFITPNRTPVLEEKSLIERKLVGCRAGRREAAGLSRHSPVWRGRHVCYWRVRWDDPFSLICSAYAISQLRVDV